MRRTRCRTCRQLVSVGEWPFCPHGTMGQFSVRGDDIPGGRIVENLDPHPTRYDTKSAIKQRMAELGVEEHVKHVPLLGSDKSPHTTRWI